MFDGIYMYIQEAKGMLSTTIKLNMNLFELGFVISDYKEEKKKRLLE